MLKKLFASILFLGVIPCDPALFTFFLNPALGKQISLGLNIIVCAIAFFLFIKNLNKNHLYEKISTKYILFFVAMLFLNIFSTMINSNNILIFNRTMSMICLCAYYLYCIYAFKNAHSLIKSINASLLILVIMSILLYYIDYEKATYIENSTTRYFKGVSLNRNSYAEITLFFITSNLYLWTKSKRHSLYYILTTALAVYTTYLTHSATTGVSLTLLIALWIIYVCTKKTLPFKAVMAMYFTIFVSMIIIQSSNTPFLSEIIEYFEKDTSLTGRTQIWKISLDLISDNLILGSGFDNYNLLFKGISENDPHNSILYMLLTQGLCGTILFLSLFFSTISKAKFVLKNNNMFNHMYIFIIAWLIRGLTESVFSYAHFVFWISIIIIEMLILEREKELISENEIFKYNI